MATDLKTYVGRKFVIKSCRYGVLDGLTAEIMGTQEVGSYEFLVADIPGSEFSPALVSPRMFLREVK